MRNEKEIKGAFPPKYVKRYVTAMITLGVVLSLTVGTVLVIVSFERAELLPYFLLRELGKAILLTVLVSIAINWYFRSQLSVIETEKQELDRQLQEEKEAYEREKDERFRQTVNDQLDTIREEVLMQTSEIANQAVSFDALQAADVDRFYRSRDEASESIKDSLQQKGVSSIKLIGISLNDFMRDENTDLHDAWMVIRQYVEADRPPEGAESLDVKLLVIDPRSNGAHLRAKAEGTEGLDSRLNSDVSDTMRDLYELEHRVCNNKNPNRKVTFAARVYRSIPALFLVWTPDTAFVQPYHFRPRHTRSRIPTIKYHNSGEPDCTHKELDFHFECMWNNASIRLDEHMNEHSIGVDDAIRNANIMNMFYNFEESRSRIVKLIENTKNILWIKGISLQSYFTHAREDLFSVVANAYERGVDVRILLINPDSEQAIQRSFREYLLSHPTSQLDRFDERARSNERLFRDTIGSIRFIKLELRGRLVPGTDLNVRLYNSSPECFTLLTDESVLVEQYHYGKIVDRTDENRPGLILGGDVPVTEYGKITARRDFERRRDPYQLFKDSFNYVFKHCSIDLDEYPHPGLPL